MRVSNKLTLAERISLYSAPQENGCVLWTGQKDREGYGRLSWLGKKIRAHRATWELKNGPIAYGLFACHRCDNRACVNPDHIFVGTHQQNMEDMVFKGRSAKGSRHVGSRLTEDQALEILLDRRSCNVLSRIYGVSHVTILRIKDGRAWSHLSDVVMARRAAA